MPTGSERSVRAIAVLAALLLLAPGLAAQVKPSGDVKPEAAPTRRGFWIGLAAGYGTASEQCSGCPDEAALQGATFLASVGWGLSEHVVLAVEPYIWINGGGAFTRTQENEIQRGDFTALAQVYPWASRGTFVRAGAGYSSYWTTINTIERRADGFALHVGAGQDFHVSRRLVVRTSVTLHEGRLGEVRELVLGRPGGPVQTWASSASQQVLAIDIGLFFHPPLH